MAQSFPYAVDKRVVPVLLPFGVIPGRDAVTLTDDGTFKATFGFFSVETPIDNIATAQNTGPYRLLTAVGLRLSAKDSGVTFGTTNRCGACVTFREKVDRVVGFHPHRGLTVTVADPDGLVAAIKAAQAA